VNRELGAGPRQAGAPLAAMLARKKFIAGVPKKPATKRLVGRS
jgi:hypothetical protein